MIPTCSRGSCDGCSQASRFVCHCLQVTEEAVLAALDNNPIRDIRDLRAYTGAGDGCTACHRSLQRYVERYALAMSAEPLAAAG